MEAVNSDLLFLALLKVSKSGQPLGAGVLLSGSGDLVRRSVIPPLASISAHAVSIV